MFGVFLKNYQTWADENFVVVASIYEEICLNYIEILTEKYRMTEY
jgi:hypothetical protein